MKRMKEAVRLASFFHTSAPHVFSAATCNVLGFDHGQRTSGGRHSREPTSSPPSVPASPVARRALGVVPPAAPLLPVAKRAPVQVADALVALLRAVHVVLRLPWLHLVAVRHRVVRVLRRCGVGAERDESLAGRTHEVARARGWSV